VEMWRKMYDFKDMALEDYRDSVIRLDDCRTVWHNIVLDSINILNRIADQHGIPAIYDGEVSREHSIRARSPTRFWPMLKALFWSGGSRHDYRSIHRCRQNN